MSEYRGKKYCPRCDSGLWKLSDWTTYVSVVCNNCGYKAGELSQPRETEVT